MLLDVVRYKGTMECRSGMQQIRTTFSQVDARPRISTRISNMSNNNFFSLKKGTANSFRWWWLMYIISDCTNL